VKTNIKQFTEYLLLFIGLQLFSDCYNKEETEKDPYAVKYSKVIHRYNGINDTLKLKALIFLLSNLKDQFFLQSEWTDRLNTVLLKNDSITVLTLIRTNDSIHRICSSVFSTIQDDSVITDSFLIETIDRAFETRKYKWSQNIPFSDFCEYVLPYKTGNEKPENWGACLNSEQYLQKDSLKQIKTVFEAAAYVNSHLNWIHATVNYDYPIDLGFSMSKIIATGTCYTQARIALFILKSLGLPGVIDFVPSWGNRSDGHYWNAVIIDNKAFPFDPTGPNIGFYKIQFKGLGRMPYKISKVFRQTYAVQSNSLSQLNNSNEPVPQIFISKRLKDVTNMYTPTSDIELRYHSTISRNFAYLFTFNDKIWIPSYWGRVVNNDIQFENMGRDIVYLPGLYLNNDETVPIGNPFILTGNGDTRELHPNMNITQDLQIWKKYPEDVTNNIVKGDRYKLFYWDFGWISLGEKIADTNRLEYLHAPTNALFLIRDLTKGKQERIFTYENNKQIWW